VNRPPEPSAEPDSAARQPRVSGHSDRLRALPRVVWLLGLASLLNDVSSEAIFPLLPTFLLSLGAPMSFLGLIEGSADALGSIIKMAAGKLSDRGPRRTLVAGGYALPALARAGIAAALAPWQVLAARLLDRAGKGIRSGPRDALIADSVAPSQRGRAFGLNRAMDNFGAALGPIIAWALLSFGASLRTTFAVASVFGLMAPVVLFYRLRENEQIADRSGPLDTRPRGGTLQRGFSVYLMACVLFAFGNSSDAFLLVRAHQVGWSATALPLLWSFHHLVKSVAAVPGGALSDRHWWWRPGGPPTRSPTWASPSPAPSRRS
jgi:MFS family permease